MRKNILCKTLLALLLLLGTIQTKAQLVILSGVKGGSYEQFANDIKGISTNPVEVKTSNGSVHNFRQLTQKGGIDVTFLQEDVLYNQQANDLEKGINTLQNIRVLLPLGYEEIHLIARATDNSINKIEDLDNKKVAVGDDSQGTYITASLIKEKTGRKWIDVKGQLVLNEVLENLKNKTIDAFFFVGAAPVSFIKNNTDIKLISLKNKILKEIYYPITIKAESYAFLKEDFTTFGVKSVLVTNTKNETIEHRRKIEFLLADLNNKMAELQKNAHRKWKQVDLDFTNLDWEAYPGAERVFNPKENTLSPEIILLSGVEGGSYHEFAENIKDIVKQKITVKTSSGSSANLEKLIARDEIFVTFLQFDVLVQQKLKNAEEGTDFTDYIKLVLPLGKEEIHLIARKDDEKIKKIRHLKDKKVAIGTENQGTYVTANLIKSLTNAKWTDVILPFDKALISLQNKEIDAFFFVGSAPVSKFEKLNENANIKLIPLKNRKLEKIYTKTIVPKSTYKWMDEDVRTYAVKSVLATNIKEETIAQTYNLTKMIRDINENIEKLRTNGHPKWKEVDFDFNNIEWPVYLGTKEVLNK